MDKARIMVVDDEESMCKFMEIMLKKEGYQKLQVVARGVETNMPPPHWRWSKTRTTIWS